MTAVILQTILGNQCAADGIEHKVALNGKVYLNAHGLESDSGIKEYFADPDCALMHYAGEHYDFWRQRYPTQAQEKFTAGLFGENFFTFGMTEASVCLGDIYQLGSAEIQVSWGRVACQTMANRLEDPGAPELMHQLSRNGWFYRVLTAGETSHGDTFKLTERPAAAWPLTRVQNIIFAHSGNQEELAALAAMPFLAAGWRKQAEERLQHLA